MFRKNISSAKFSYNKCLIDSSKSIIKENVTWYFSKTALHGFYFLRDKSTSPLMRTVFAIMNICSLSLCLYLILMQIDSYQHQVLVTKVVSTTFPVWKIRFPSVIVCNFNLVYKENTKGLAKLMTSHGVDEELFDDFLGELNSLVLYENVENASRYNVIYNVLEKFGYDLDEVMDEVAHPCNKMVKQCFWRTREVPCRNIIHQVKTRHGYCCAFNYYGMYNIPSHIIDPDNVNHTYKSLVGSYGLRLVLDAEKEQYMSPLAPLSGFNVLVFDGADYPNLNQMVTNALYPNQELKVSVNPTIYVTSEEVKAMPIEHRKCLYKYEYKGEFQFSPVYSYRACMNFCRAAAIFKLCRCMPFHYPYKASSKRIIKENVTWYFSKTALHGLYFLRDKNPSPLMRTVVAIMNICSLGLCIYLILMQIDSYQHQVLITKVVSTTFSVWKIRFPSVVVCNFNVVYKENTKGLAKLMTSHGVDEELFDDFLRKLNHLVLSRSVGNASRYNVIYDVLERFGYDLDEVMHEVAHPCNKMVKQCFWKTREVPCYNIIHQVKARHGYCCAFNYYGMYNIPSHIIDPDNVNNTYKSLVGSYGLRLVLDAEKEQYMSPLAPLSGFKVLVFDGADYPNLNQMVTNILYRNHELKVSVNPIIYVTSDEVKAMPIERRKCLYKHEGDRQLSPIYSYRNCMNFCRAAAIFKLCRCMPFFYPYKASSKRIIKENVTWYFSKTTLHGFYFLRDKNASPLMRTVFAIMNICSLSLCIYLILMQIDSYQHQILVTKVVSTTFPVWKFRFPSVVVCNFNVVYKENTKGLAKLMISHGVDEELFDDFLRELNSLVLYENVENASRYNVIYDVLERFGYNLDVVMHEVAHPCNKMVKQCFWRTRAVPCYNIIHQVKARHGYCCAFNYYGMYNIPSHIIDPDNVNNTYTSLVGSYGLRLVLHAEKEQYMSPLAPLSGFNVLVFDGADYPNLDQMVTNTLYRNHELKVSVNPIIYVTSDEVKAMPIERRKCLYKHEGDRQLSPIYSYRACMNFCRAAAIFKLCGCMPFHYPYKDQPRICDMNDLACLEDNKHKYAALHIPTEYLLEDIPDQEESSDFVYCECYHQCNERIYNVNSFTSKIVGEEYANLSILNVYYDKADSTKIEKDVYITWDRILSDIGGIFSLCLGGSILSIVEFAYFLFRMTAQLISNRKIGNQEKEKPRVVDFTHPHDARSRAQAFINSFHSQAN